MRYVLIIYFAIGDPNGIVERGYPSRVACMEAGFHAYLHERRQIVYWDCERR